MQEILKAIVESSKHTSSSCWPQDKAQPIVPTERLFNSTTLISALALATSLASFMATLWVMFLLLEEGLIPF